MEINDKPPATSGAASGILHCHEQIDAAETTVLTTKDYTK